MVQGFRSWLAWDLLAPWERPTWKNHYQFKHTQYLERFHRLPGHITPHLDSFHENNHFNKQNTGVFDLPQPPLVRFFLCYGVFPWVSSDSQKKHKNKKELTNQGRQATSLFCKIKLLFLSKDSGGFSSLSKWLKDDKVTSWKYYKYSIQLNL